MTKRQMQSDINRTAKAIRKNYKEEYPKGEKVIEINSGLPYVTMEHYFFQGEEASNLLDEANKTADKFNVSVENALLWMSSSW